MVTSSPLAIPFEFESFVNKGEQRWNSRNDEEITTVVLHHMAMTDYDGVPEVWRTREASAHYGIGPNGEIRAYVGEEKRAWHAGNGNSYSIGIECCNASMGPDWKVNEETVNSLIKLIQDINLRYGKTMIITGHKCIPGNATECPGPSLTPRLSEIRQRVNEKEQEVEII